MNTILGRVMSGITGFVFAALIVFYLTMPAFRLTCEEVSPGLVGPRTSLLGFSMLATIIIAPLFAFAFKRRVFEVISAIAIIWAVCFIYFGINN